MLGRGWFGDIVVRAQTRVGGLFARRMGATLRVQVVAGWGADNGTVLRTGIGFQHALGRTGYSGGFVLGTFASGVAGWDAQVTCRWWWGGWGFKSVTNEKWVVAGCVFPYRPNQ